MPPNPYRRQPNINDMMYPKGSKQPRQVWAAVMNVYKEPETTSPVTPTPTPTNTVTPTNTGTPTPTPSETPTSTPSNVTPTPTPTSTLLPPVNYIAGASSFNNLGYSYDGLLWSASTSANTQTITYSLATDGSIYVAGGYKLSGGVYSNQFLYSYDAINWSDGTPSKLFSLYTNSVKYNGSIWVAGGQNASTATTLSSIAYSNNGINWSAGTVTATPNPYIIYDTAYNGNMWLGVGLSTGTTVGVQTKVIYSYDGINWSGQTNTLFNSTNYGVAWNGTLWVIGGSSSNARLAYSYDGFNWSASTNGNTIFTSYAYKLRWSNDKFIVGGFGTNSMGYSYDGITWSASTNGNTFLNTGQGVSYDGSNYFAGGRRFTGATGSRIIKSIDGITWSATTNSDIVFTGTGGVYSVIYKQPNINPTPTVTPTNTSTPTNTPTNTETPTPTQTSVTPTPTPTPTQTSVTPTQTPTPSATPLPLLTFLITSGQSEYDACNGVSGTIYATDIGNCGGCYGAGLNCLACLTTTQGIYIDSARTILAPNAYYANEMAPGNFAIIEVRNGTEAPGGFQGGCPGSPPSPPTGAHPYMFTGYSANTIVSSYCEAYTGGTPCTLYGDTDDITTNTYLYNVSSGSSTTNLFGSYSMNQYSGGTGPFICFYLDSYGQNTSSYQTCSSSC
jgi:hypothetical protein